MTVILQHETDTTTALEIMRTRRFIAGPILGDAGLNACIVGHHRGKYHADQAGRRGAILEFEWSGPVSADTIFVSSGTERLLRPIPAQGVYLRRHDPTSSPCRAYATGRLV